MRTKQDLRSTVMVISLSSGSTSRLNLINKVDDVILLADVLQALEPSVGAVVVSALRLYRLHYDPSDGTARLLTVGDDVLGHLQTSLVLRAVLPDVVLQGVAVPGEVSHGPDGQGDVDLVDIFGVGAGQRGCCATVETSVERENCEVGCSRGLIDHAGLHLLGTEVSTIPDLVHVLKETSSH